MQKCVTFYLNGPLEANDQKVRYNAALKNNVEALMRS